MNLALWTRSPAASDTVGPAPIPRPAEGQLVVLAHAVAVNPVDAIRGVARRFVTPWLHYPAVLGSDVSGTVVQTGPGVDRFRTGDRVVGHAAGQERHRNDAAEGAFQHYVLLSERLCSPLPDGLPFAQAAVLPLALSTAAAGLFEPDQLGLPIPRADDVPARRNEAVLIWGASTSVGCNAVQLARAVGFDVLATASPHNHDVVESLGADAVFDYHDQGTPREILRVLKGRPLAGTMAIGAGSLARTMAVVRAADGTRRLASAYPTPVTTVRGLLARRHEVRVSAIWGGRPTETEVGPAIYRDYLPWALASGRHRAAPLAEVVGRGLDDIPAALEQLRRGVSARKLVVELT